MYRYIHFIQTSISRDHKVANNFERVTKQLRRIDM